MERIRVGVIGVGWFGTVHCRVIAGHPELELAALCDASEERLAEMAREHGVARTCTDYRELAEDPEIDALAVVTPWEHTRRPRSPGSRPASTCSSRSRWHRPWRTASACAMPRARAAAS